MAIPAEAESTSTSGKMPPAFEELYRTLLARLHDNHGYPYMSDIPGQALPQNYSLRQLNEILSSSPVPSSQGEQVKQKLVRVAAVNRCLQARERLISEGDHDSCAKCKLYAELSAAIRPDPVLFAGIDRNSAEKEVIQQWKSMSILALNSIRDLELFIPTQGEEAIDPATLLSLLAFTRPADIWNTTPAYEVATDILRRNNQAVCSEEFITGCVLTDYIRPLFMKSRPDTITPQGRKATNIDAAYKRQNRSNESDPALKPWKHSDIHAATVFGWAVVKAKGDLIAKSWHLFIPPLLALLDEPTSSLRAYGLMLLGDFLPKAPPRMLGQTGLGDVFEEAVMPTLLFLPDLTPVDESLLLLEEAYKALFALASTRFAAREDLPNKNRLLDRILRQGVFYGLNHCRGNANITELLLKEMRCMVSQAEVHSIKHLKDIMPILSSILIDPFAPSTPAVLLQGIRAVQDIILNCWPIMTEQRHRIELVKALSVCWISVSEEIRNGNPNQESELRALLRETKTASLLLLKSVEGTVDFRSETEALMAANPDVSDLFEFDSDGESTA